MNAGALADAQQLLRVMVAKWVKESPLGRAVVLETGLTDERAVDHVLDLIELRILVIETGFDLRDLDVDDDFQFTIRPTESLDRATIVRSNRRERRRRQARARRGRR